jgi:hypothetical protein
MRDNTLDLRFLDGLRSAQRELGLLHGDRPTCPFLRPHILSRTKYQTIKTAAETIANAFEKVAREALRNDKLLRLLDLTAAEEEMARVDPGYSRLCITSRLDAYLTSDGFQFLEYNAETPAGVGDQMQLEKVLFRLPQMKDFLESNDHWLPQPHRSLLDALVAAYREWGGEEEYARIAIVDWEGVPTRSEFFVLRDYFELRGYPTIVADPHDLTYDGDRLRVNDFPIDVLYKRVIIHEFLHEFDAQHPLARAYKERRVCMVNSFRTKVAHKKAAFAVLTNPKYAGLFDAHELAAIRKHVPWTRYVEPSTTIFENRELDLLSLIRSERERFVLKPNDDYGGHGVFLGWETEADQWEQEIALAVERSYVVQERAEVDKIAIPAFSDHVTLEEMFVDFNPFLFQNEVEGGLVRLSASSLLNVTSGGGQTALLVLED